MGVMMAAVWPTSLDTRDSLELSVLLNIKLKNHRKTSAMINPDTREMGALIQTLLVALICERIKPTAPKVVTKLASTVGLKNEMPGSPWLARPDSAWPPASMESWPPAPKKWPKKTLRIEKASPRTRQMA